MGRGGAASGAAGLEPGPGPCRRVGSGESLAARPRALDAFGWRQALTGPCAQRWARDREERESQGETKGREHPRQRDSHGATRRQDGQQPTTGLVPSQPGASCPAWSPGRPRQRPWFDFRSLSPTCQGHDPPTSRCLMGVPGERVQGFGDGKAGAEGGAGQGGVTDAGTWPTLPYTPTSKPRSWPLDTVSW